MILFDFLAFSCFRVIMLPAGCPDAKNKIVLQNMNNQDFIRSVQILLPKHTTECFQKTVMETNSHGQFKSFYAVT